MPGGGSDLEHLIQMRQAQACRQMRQYDPNAPEPGSSVRGWLIFLSVMVLVLVGAGLVAHFFATTTVQPPRH